jgi:hypothetical protein
MVPSLRMISESLDLFLAAGRLKPMPFPRRRSIVEARAAFVQSGHHMLGAARGMTGCKIVPLPPD